MREKLGSRLGFILLSAGCAIGIGNVWKFPYMAGQYGGGFFVLLYLIFLVIMGVPVLTMEFSLGRASQKSPVQMYQQLEPKGTKWHIHGYFAMAGNYILMMFYTVVCGWMLSYFVSMASGKLTGLDTAGVESFYENDLLGNMPLMLVYTAIAVVIGFLVCSFSLQKGLERVTKVLMVALLGIMVMLAVNSIFLDGGIEGLKFYLVPSLDSLRAVGNGSLVNGLFGAITGAMNQAFFTLSLGIGSMAIFGSYLNKDRSLMGEAVNVAVLDTFVAITSGLIIFPACYAFGVKPDAGPSLIFKTLPNVFNNMDSVMGRICGSLFFLFLSFAALSTVFAVFENIIACTMDQFKLSRKKACLVNCVLMLVLSVPCVLGFNVLKGFNHLGAGSTVLDLEDFIVSNILLPLGSLTFVIFCTWRYGWGWKSFKEEANQGKGLKVHDWMRGYMKYVLPVIVLVIFVVGIYNVFK
ncbi:MAG: sodium-dependent transporter [Clostridia bacterium]|nr:sodium-dependent transporter [Clostridia bacterium]